MLLILWAPSQPGKPNRRHDRDSLHNPQIRGLARGTRRAAVTAHVCG